VEKSPVARQLVFAEAMPRLVRNRDLWLILTALVITTYLHYSTNRTLQTIHTVYRSLYYLPILYAALRFGLRGGLTVALVSGAAYVPYVFILAEARPAEVVEDLLEALIYVSVGMLTGLLVDAGRRQRARQRELEAQVRRAERLSALGTLAGGLAHEVRNPLGSIRASAQMLAEESDEPEAGEFLTVIQSEADRINRLVESLLDYARPEHVEVGPVELNQLLDTVAQLTQSYAAHARVEVQIRPSADGLVVRGERDRLHQCLLNLTLNAIQAMPDGGRLHLALDRAGRQACLTVADTGQGIQEADLARLFDPFFSTKDGGTGLGLAITQRIVADHGGQIEVDSSLGEGSVFRVWLPLADSDQR
jgi:two-component system, NtrC family, sensor histidine kinase HydH